MVNSVSVIESLKSNTLYPNDYDFYSEIQRKIVLSREIFKGLHIYSQLSNQTEIVSLTDRLRNRYEADISEPEKKQVVDSEIPENDNGKKIPLRFDDNETENMKRLNMILNNARRLKNDYTETLGSIKDNEIYFKTINSFISKTEAFINKGVLSPVKIAKEIVKNLSTTLIKNYANQKLKNVLDDFMTSCNFNLIELPVGKKIEDDDLDYISDNCYKIDVSNRDMHNTIIEKRHDAFVFECYDSEEEEFYQKIIPGEYAIGSWKE